MNELDPTDNQTTTPTNPSVVGPPRHPRRNAIVVAGVVLCTLAMVVFYSYFHRSDKVALDRLHKFLTAYSEKCAIPKFVDKMPPALAKIYVDSPKLEAVIDQQLTALDSGATCYSIAADLNAAQFPMPPHADTVGAADRPTIELQPQAATTP